MGSGNPHWSVRFCASAVQRTEPKHKPRTRKDRSVGCWIDSSLGAETQLRSYKMVITVCISLKFKIYLELGVLGCGVHCNKIGLP